MLTIAVPADVLPGREEYDVATIGPTDPNNPHGIAPKDFPVRITFGLDDADRTNLTEYFTVNELKLLVTSIEAVVESDPYLSLYW